MLSDFIKETKELQYRLTEKNLNDFKNKKITYTEAIDNEWSFECSKLQSAYTLGQEDIKNSIRKYRDFAFKESEECLVRGLTMIAYDFDSRVVACNHILKEDIDAEINKLKK
jgi:hypothetical protein